MVLGYSGNGFSFWAFAGTDHGFGQLKHDSVALRQGKTPAAIARTAHGEPSLVSLLQASFECENDYCDMSFDGTSHVQQPPRFRSVRKRNLCTW